MEEFRFGEIVKYFREGVILERTSKAIARCFLIEENNSFPKISFQRYSYVFKKHGTENINMLRK